MPKHVILGCIVLAALAVTSCGVSPVKLQAIIADKVAATRGLTKVYRRGGPFTLLTYRRIRVPTAPLTIYIEGDGSAWITRSQASLNPTPKNAVTLQLLAADNRSVNVAYVARPCQYFPSGTQPACEQKIWTSHRFGDEVIGSINTVVSDMVRESGVSRIHLVGFSGGATVALLLAARRNDVLSVRTVAGNLDHQVFTTHHRVTPLVNSLNPVDVTEKLRDIPQRHFVGEFDAVIPGLVSRCYQRKLGHSDCSKVHHVLGISHVQGWAEQWPALLDMDVSCTPWP